MGVNGRAKGSSFERLIAKAFSEWCGHKVDRTPLSGGWANAKAHGTCGDLVVEKSYAKLFPFTVECKKHEGWCLDDLLHNDGTKLRDWWSQACDEGAQAGKVPLLVMARNRVPPVAVLRLSEYAAMLPDRSFTFFMRTRDGKWNADVVLLRLEDLLKQWPAPRKKEK